MVITWVYSHWWSFGTWGVKTGAFSGDQRMNIAAIFIWLVVWNMNFIFPYIGNNHHPNWRTHIFQRGGYTTNQSCSFLGLRLFDPYRQSRMIKKMLSRDKSARFFTVLQKNHSTGSFGMFWGYLHPIDNGLAFRPPNHFFGDTQIKNQEYD